MCTFFPLICLITICIDKLEFGYGLWNWLQIRKNEALKIFSTGHGRYLKEFRRDKDQDEKKNKNFLIFSK